MPHLYQSTLQLHGNESVVFPIDLSKNQESIQQGRPKAQAELDHPVRTCHQITISDETLPRPMQKTETCLSITVCAPIAWRTRAGVPVSDGIVAEKSRHAVARATDSRGGITAREVGGAVLACITWSAHRGRRAGTVVVIDEI